ncbi:MAG: hypothetical protein AB7N73_14935 [Gemmatimonadales bacterium]
MSGRAKGAAARPARLEPEVAAWIHETRELIRYLLEQELPDTGGLGRSLRREVLTLHAARADLLLGTGTPETAAADALREAVAWYELREEAARAAGRFVEDPPSWVHWAHRLLPSVGLSRWAALTARTVDDNERLRPRAGA